jgi:hypothetical protein
MMAMTAGGLSSIEKGDPFGESEASDRTRPEA